MAKGKNVYVSPRKDGTTAVKKEGAKRASVVSGTKKEALQEGRKIAKKEQSELIVKGKDGKIQNKDSFGNDPHLPKG